MKYWLRRLLGEQVPADFSGSLEPDEYVAAAAGRLVASSLGLWVPADEGFRRIPWHLISHVTWSDAVLSVVEATESRWAGAAVLIVDQRPMRFPLEKPGLLPRAVRKRVNASIASRYYKELPGGGAWFVQRRVAGRGAVLQVRVDRGTDVDIAMDIAAEAAERLPS